MIEFGRYAEQNRRRRALGKPETFNCLSFTLICAKSRRGHFQIRRKTRRDRMGARLKEIREGLRVRRHHPIPVQGRWLEQVVRGFFNYHAVPTNMRALEAFRTDVIRSWRQALKMRSHRDKTTYDRMIKIAEEWLPKPKILHPWPDVRFAAKHLGWELDAGKLHVWIYAGGAQ